MIFELKKREDLIGKTGTMTKQFDVLDASESKQGISLFVVDSEGDKYWVAMDQDIQLD